MWSPLARDRRAPEGFIQPCVPVLADVAPSGPDWLHEIKHDGYRLIARKDGDRVRLWSRQGRDWTASFAGIAAAIRTLPAASLVLDGEAVAHTSEGLPDFHALRSRYGAESATLFAFDVLLVDEEDLRPQALIQRKARLARLPARGSRLRERGRVECRPPSPRSLLE